MLEPAKKEPTSPMVSGAVCLVSGLLMSCWGPLSAYAQDKTAAGSLNPYFAFFLFALVRPRRIRPHFAHARAHCGLWLPQHWTVASCSHRSIAALAQMEASRESIQTGTRVLGYGE